MAPISGLGGLINPALLKNCKARVELDPTDFYIMSPRVGGTLFYSLRLMPPVRNRLELVRESGAVP